MPKTTLTADQDSTSWEIDIAAPPGRVFEAFFTSDQLMRWFTDASCPVKFWQIDARPGGRYSYATEKNNFVVNGRANFSATAKSWNSIRPVCSSTPGSATGISIRTKKPSRVGSSHPHPKVHM
jgi:Activator of Hsp90 ATPase homolog 1-like protein